MRRVNLVVVKEKVDEVGLLEEIAEDVCYLLVNFRVESLKEEEGGNIEGR